MDNIPSAEDTAIESAKGRIRMAKNLELYFFEELRDHVSWYNGAVRIGGL